MKNSFGHHIVTASPPGKSYKIHTGPDTLRHLPKLIIESGSYSRTCIICDENVAKLYEPNLHSLLSSLPIPQAESFVFPPGESSKSIHTLQLCFRHLFNEKLDRDALIIALGGGVTGDLAGFCAATFKRGIDYIQIPTSLLAQADASVGGKTAINFGPHKNAIGSFHQPALVICDTDCLNTLPRRHLANGIAEIVKMGIIGDPALFDLLEQTGNAMYNDAKNERSEAVFRSVKLKAEIVNNDPYEKFGRMVLNLGHTIGHALESVTHFQRYLHGEAVALGMVSACVMAVELKLAQPDLVDRLKKTLQALELPILATGLNANDILVHISHDKKRAANQNRWVIPMRIGNAKIVENLPESIIRAGLNAVIHRSV